MSDTVIVVALIASTVPVVAVALLLKYMIGRLDEELIGIFGFFVGLAAVISPVIVAGMIIDGVK